MARKQGSKPETSASGLSFTRQVTSRAAAGGTTLVAGATGTAAALGAPLGGLSKFVTSNYWATGLAVVLVLVGAAYEVLLVIVGKNLSSAREWLASPSSLRVVVLDCARPRADDTTVFGRSEFVDSLRQKLDSQHLSPASGIIGMSQHQLSNSQRWWSFAAWLTGTYISPDRLDEAADAGLKLFMARKLIVKIGAQNLDERYMIVDKLNDDPLGVSPPTRNS